MIATLKIAGRLAVENVRFRARQVARRVVRKTAEIVLSDLDLTAALGQIGEAAAFEREHLMDAAYFKGRHQLFAYVLSKIPQDGLLLEFGVYKGDSINRLAGLIRFIQGAARGVDARGPRRRLRCAKSDAASPQERDLDPRIL
jgi:hypothetical protein